MADSNHDQFVPEISANVENEQFAEDLVHCVMLRNSPTYASQISYQSTRAFDQIIQIAVQFIEYMLEKSDDDTFLKMLNANSVCEPAYETFVQKGAIKCLTTDFDAKNVLIYCVTISKIAALFYNNGISDAPNIAVRNISIVLLKYNMTADEWGDLSRVAQQFDNLLPEIKSQITHSGEIKPLISSQKVIGYGSTNVLPSGKHNFLSDNKENLEQKQYCVCSKLETLLEKFVQYFSGKSTDIDLSPFKEPESPLEDLPATFNFEGNICKRIDSSESNVKLISSMSKTDQKFDLAENELQLKLDKCAVKDNFIPGPSSSCQKSDLTNKSDCRGETYTGITVKPYTHSEKLTIEGDDIDNFSSTDCFLKSTSNTCQTSSFTSAKGNIDLPSNEKNVTNYTLAISVEEKLPNESEPNDKLVTETPDNNQTSKKSLYISSCKETNTSAENVPLRDEESPKLKDST